MGWPNCPRIQSQRSSMLLWWPEWPSSALFIRLPRQWCIDCQIQTLAMYTECPIAKIGAVWRLQTDVSAPDDRLLYPTPRNTECHLLWCMPLRPYRVSSTKAALYHRFILGLGDQWNRIAPSTACMHVMTWIKPFVVPHLLGAVWPGLYSYLMSRWIPAWLQNWQVTYSRGHFSV